MNDDDIFVFDESCLLCDGTGRVECDADYGEWYVVDCDQCKIDGLTQRNDSNSDDMPF